MARAATTTDAFNAVAEPRRRQILDALADGERPVNDLVRLLGLKAQPQVSKHLRVLREVGAVDVRGQGRQRLYSLNGRALKPIHDWVQAYETSWSERSTGWMQCWSDLKEEEDGWQLRVAGRQGDPPGGRSESSSRGVRRAEAPGVAGLHGPRACQALVAREPG